MRLCRKKRLKKTTLARSSFRWGEWEPCKHGQCRHLFACAKGDWASRQKVCKSDMQIYETFVKSSGARCPRGYRKSTKKGF